MIRTLTLAALIAAALLGPALVLQSTPAKASEAKVDAAVIPADAEECIAAAFDLAQAAEERRLSSERVGKLEELLIRMESYCDARQFTEAMAVARDIRTAIEAE